MDFVEVLKGVRQLSQYRRCRTAIHLTDVIPFERIDEAFCHAIIVSQQLLVVAMIARRSPSRSLIHFIRSAAAPSF
jgi:hypothetical protein